MMVSLCVWVLTNNSRTTLCVDLFIYFSKMYISDSGAFILFSNREKILSPQIYLYFSIPYNYLMLKKSQTVFDLNYFKCNHFLEVAIKVALQIAPELVLDVVNLHSLHGAL